MSTPGMSQLEVASILGVSRETVRRIERRALQKCRAWCDAHGYKLDDLIGSVDTPPPGLMHHHHIDQELNDHLIEPDVDDEDDESLA
jgi:transcriptional regulator with XRE-family HTH domain